MHADDIELPRAISRRDEREGREKATGDERRERGVGFLFLRALLPCALCAPRVPRLAFRDARTHGTRFVFKTGEWRVELVAASRSARLRSEVGL